VPPASIATAETWHMPTAYPDQSYMTQNLRDFAQSVKIATDGEIDIVVHPSGSLFAGDEIKRAIQTGQVPMGERIISAHSNENAVFGFDSVPFLAPSFDDSVKLWSAAKPVLNDVLADQNLVLLFSVPWPANGIYSKTKLDSIDDLKGMRVRAYNATISQMASLAKAQPVQIVYSELTQALSTGVADATVGGGATGYEKKLWEILKYYYELDMWLPRNVVMVNKDVWDGLDKTTQSTIRGIASMAEAAGLARAKEVAGWYNTEMLEHGMEISPGSEELTAGFRAIGDIMTKDWLEKAGEDGQRIYDAYMADKPN
jgi:TRAP-type C4-dicarboxylate transport system substrate-binding protein